MDTRQRSRCHRAILTALACAVVAGTASAEDWPNWRGPNRNGISTETGWSTDWPASGPPVLWRKSIGIGFASIAVSSGRAYAMGNTGRQDDDREGEHQDAVWCFDAATGDQVWKYSYACPLYPKSHEGGPCATPTIHAGKVYTISKDGKVFCLDAGTGDVVWKRDLVREDSVKLPEWGLAGSACIIDDLAVFNAGTHGLALNKNDGKLVWINGAGPAGYATAVPYEFGGRTCLAILGVETIAAVVARTGQVLWVQPWKTKYDENIPDPIAQGDKLFVVTALGTGSALFRMEQQGLTELWRQKDFQNWLNSSVLWQGHLYGIDETSGAVRCVEFETGRVLWSQPGFRTGSLMLADGKLIILSANGKLAVAPASPDGYRELASAQILSGKCWTVPVLANGRIYARNAVGDMVCLDVRRKGR